ncbi:Flp pilus assembly protein CpaB [Fredinandcohnia salidurans]|uniref:Flp pilus assembly protein CpaB n=1 Tax=Fredinandcohnia salidurans TaxID=2595041 RepID=A0ABW4MUU5_9BACI
MNTKKIWIAAMVFGLVASGLLYILLNTEQPTKAQTASKEVAQEDKDEENEEIVQPEETEVASAESSGIKIAKGNRAMTFGVTDVQGVAGLVKPGSFVDVVAVMTVPEEYKAEGQPDSATLLLQNVKVLEIGHAADNPETEKKRYQMVTVEVTPKQGLALGFASRYELYLMLREEGDHDVEPTHTHVHEDQLHEGVFK